MRHARHRQDGGGIAVDTPTIQRQRNVQVLEVMSHRPVPPTMLVLGGVQHGIATVAPQGHTLGQRGRGREL